MGQNDWRRAICTEAEKWWCIDWGWIDVRNWSNSICQKKVIYDFISKYKEKKEKSSKRKWETIHLWKSSKDREHGKKWGAKQTYWAFAV